MNLSLTDSERIRLGSANLEAFFTHLNALVEDPTVLVKIPNGSSVVFETGDPWVDGQNQQLASQLRADGSEVVCIATTAPKPAVIR